MAKKKKNKYIPIYIMIAIFLVSFSCTVVTGKLLEAPTKSPVDFNSDTSITTTDTTSESPVVTDSEVTDLTDTDTESDTATDSGTDTASDSDGFIVTQSIPDSEQPEGLTNILSSNSLGYSDLKGTQLIVVNTRSVYADVYLWEKQMSGEWKQVNTYNDGFIGYWGLSSSPSQNDKFTPSGFFDIGKAFGVEDSIETSLEYFKLGDNACWVSDKNSELYNTYDEDGQGDYVSSLSMGGVDSYKYGAEIKSGGNMTDIFLCCGTECTNRDIALSEEHLKEILTWLNKAGQPQILIY